MRAGKRQSSCASCSIFIFLCFMEWQDKVRSSFVFLVCFLTPRFFFFKKKDGIITIITEYVSLGSLHRVLADKAIDLPWWLRLKFAIDAADALQLRNVFLLVLIVLTQFPNTKDSCTRSK
jgi:hypothetical protein